MPRALPLLVLVALGACSEPLPAPRAERVALEGTFERLDARQEMLLERAGVERIRSDARDAWTIPVGASAQVDVPWPAGSTAALASAACLQRLAGAPASGRVRLEVRAADGDASWQTELDLADPTPRWQPVRLDVGANGKLGLVLSAEWVGDPPQGADKVRAAFEVAERARGKPAPPAGAPNVLVVTVDTLRSDRLGSYGSPRGLTPNLDALAARGARFVNAYSSAPWTLPSYGSLFTGLYPGEHRAGIVTEREALYGQDVDSTSKRTEMLRPDVTTLAEVFARAGWSTAMLQNNPYLARQSGLERGFERYVGYGSNARNGVDQALAWMDEARGAPWFLVVYLMDPHFPYAPPAPFDVKYANTSVDKLADWPPNLDELRQGKPAGGVAQLSVTLYDGEVAFTDEQVGRLLAGLEERGLAEGTVVVLHSDHGEEFWEHGSCDHGHTQYEELLRVPLIVSWPGHVPAQIVGARVRALDLMPTLCRLAGLPPPEGIDGEDLAPLWRGEGGSRNVIAEALHSGAREMKAALSQQWKVVARGASETWCYDLQRDPYERASVADEEPDPTRALRGLLAEHHARSVEAARRARELELSADQRAQMERIGYAGADRDDGRRDAGPDTPETPK